MLFSTFTVRIISIASSSRGCSLFSIQTLKLDSLAHASHTRNKNYYYFLSFSKTKKILPALRIPTINAPKSLMYEDHRMLKLSFIQIQRRKAL